MYSTVCSSSSAARPDGRDDQSWSVQLSKHPPFLPNLICTFGRSASSISRRIYSCPCIVYVFSPAKPSRDLSDGPCAASKFGLQPILAVSQLILKSSIVLSDIFAASYHSEASPPCSASAQCGGNRRPLIRFDERDRMGSPGTSDAVRCLGGFGALSNPRTLLPELNARIRHDCSRKESPALEGEITLFLA